VGNGAAVLAGTIENTGGGINMEENPLERAETEADFLKRAVVYISENKNIQKYYVLKGEMDVTIKADFTLGKVSGTVIYDLENAKEIGPEVFLVPFTISVAGGAANAVGATGDADWRTSGTMRWNTAARAAGERGGVLLSFDDTFFDNWRGNFPLFEKYGARVTFFV
jgi:hypothetical protein